MTPSAYYERKIKRHQSRRFTLGSVIAITSAQIKLQDHVREKVAPSVTDTVWRSKRDGGPYRLAFGTSVSTQDVAA